MMVGGVLFLTLSNAFLVWIPVLVRQTMDSVESLADETVFGDTSVVDILISDQAGWVIAKGVLLLLAASFLYGFLLFLTRQTLIVASRYIELDLRTLIYDKLQRLPQEYYAKKPHRGYLHPCNRRRLACT